jgi:hypothetical protein
MYWSGTNDVRNAHPVWRPVIHELDEQRHTTGFMHCQPPCVIGCHCCKRLQRHSMPASNLAGSVRMLTAAGIVGEVSGLFAG